MILSHPTTGAPPVYPLREQRSSESELLGNQAATDLRGCTNVSIRSPKDSTKREQDYQFENSKESHVLVKLFEASIFGNFRSSSVFTLIIISCGWVISIRFYSKLPSSNKLSLFFFHVKYKLVPGCHSLDSNSSGLVDKRWSRKHCTSKINGPSVTMLGVELFIHGLHYSG